MPNDMVSRDETPSWALRESTGAPLGNLDASDLKPPEIKLLQATSPETAEQPGARAGEFWLTGLNMNLGPEIVGTPIILKKSYVIWNPTKSLDSKGPLAVASDGVHWDMPDQEFTVYYPNNPTPYVWKTKRTVAESGLDRFGSSRPEDRRSPPAASMTYQTLWAFHLPDGRPQLGVITNSKTGIKPMNELFGMIEGNKPIDHYFLRFTIRAVRLSMRPGEYFFGWKYLAAGKVQDEAEGKSYKALYDRYHRLGFSMATDEDQAPPPKTMAHSQREDDSDDIPF